MRNGLGLGPRRLRASRNPHHPCRSSAIQMPSGADHRNGHRNPHLSAFSIAALMNSRHSTARKLLPCQIFDSYRDRTRPAAVTTPFHLLFAVINAPNVPAFRPCIEPAARSALSPRHSQRFADRTREFFDDPAISPWGHEPKPYVVSNPAARRHGRKIRSRRSARPFWNANALAAPSYSNIARTVEAGENISWCGPRADR